MEFAIAITLQFFFAQVLGFLGVSEPSLSGTDPNQVVLVALMLKREQVLKTSQCTCMLSMFLEPGLLFV